MSNYAASFIFFGHLVACLFLANWSNNTKQNFNFITAFTISFFFSPLVGAICVMLAKDKQIKLTEDEWQAVKRNQYEQQMKNGIYTENPVIQRARRNYEPGPSGIFEKKLSDKERFSSEEIERLKDCEPLSRLKNDQGAKLPKGNDVLQRSLLTADIPERFRIARYIQSCLKKFINK